MIEIEIDDVFVAFDGRVLEFWRQGMGGSERFHVTMIRPSVEGPNRRGFYEVNFESTFGPGRIPDVCARRSHGGPAAVAGRHRRRERRRLTHDRP